MRLRTRIALASLVVAAMTVVVATGGFTATEADRTVSVTVVEDDDAYVGLVYENVSVDATDTRASSSEGTFTMTDENASMVTNQFPNEFEVTVDVEDEVDGDPPDVEYALDDGASSGGVTGEGDHATVPPGERAIFDAEVECEAGDSGHPKSGTVEVVYDVESDDSSVSATVTREVDVECGNPGKRSDN